MYDRMAHFDLILFQAFLDAMSNKDYLSNPANPRFTDANQEYLLENYPELLGQINTGEIARVITSADQDSACDLTPDMYPGLAAISELSVAFREFEETEDSSEAQNAAIDAMAQRINNCLHGLLPVFDRTTTLYVQANYYAEKMAARSDPRHASEGAGSVLGAIEQEVMQREQYSSMDSLKSVSSEDDISSEQSTSSLDRGSDTEDSILSPIEDKINKVLSPKDRQAERAAHPTNPMIFRWQKIGLPNPDKESSLDQDKDIGPATPKPH